VSVLPTNILEQKFAESGYKRVAGVDEAGRGAIAGPVVAAVVVLPGHFDVEGVRDSKTVPEVERERLYSQIVESTKAWGVGIVDNRRIDKMSILQATFRAMKQAVTSLAQRPDYVLIDGRDIPKLEITSEGVIKGDSVSLSIAAASIIAKVTRDRIMRSKHEEFPYYGFRQNKGYGTVKHREAVLEYGPCTLHRLTFLGNFLQERLLL